MRSPQASRLQNYARWALPCWLVVILVLTLMPNSDAGRSLNLRPGLDLTYSARNAILNLIVNILLFVPGGALAHFANIQRLNLLTLLLGIAALSSFIEFTQYYSELGRQADINDVIANVLGCAVGFVAVAVIARPRIMVVADLSRETDSQTV